MPKVPVTIVKINGKLDLHVGTFVSDRCFFVEKPTMVTRFEVDNVFLSILNDDNFHEKTL